MESGIQKFRFHSESLRNRKGQRFRGKYDEVHLHDNGFIYLFSKFQQLILSLLSKAYDDLGFQPKENDTRLEIYNRANILKYACRFGHEECVKDARNEFDQLKQGEHE